LDDAVMRSPDRVRAVERARRTLPACPVPLDGIARLAARLLRAPTALVTLVGADEETFAGSCGAPAALVASGHATLAYSVCKYAVSVDHPVRSGDMAVDPELCRHPLAAEYGYRAFLVVPLRDTADAPIGALTVLDTQPRQWTDDEVATLLSIGEVLGPIPTDEHRAAVAAVAELDTGAVLDQLLEAFVAVTGDGRIAGWNRAAESIFGWSTAEVLGQPLDVLAVPEGRGAPVRAVLDDILTGGPDLIRKVEAVHRDGHRILLRIRLTVVRGVGGAVVCMFVDDETARVEAETDAAQAHHFTDTLLDSLQTGVLACDETGRVVVFNRAMRELHALPAGWPSGDLHTASIELLHNMRHPDGSPLEADETPLRHALAGTAIQERGVLLAVPGRPVCHLEVNARPLHEPDGARVGAVATLHDITADYRATASSDCELRISRILAQAGTLSQAAPALTAAVAQTLGWAHVALWLMDEAAGVLRPVGVWTAEHLVPAKLVPTKIAPGRGVTGWAWQTREPVWVPDLCEPPPAIAGLLDNELDVALAGGVGAMLAVPVPGGPEPVGVISCISDFPQPDDAQLEASLTGVAAQIGYFVSRQREQELAHELNRSKEDYVALVGHELRTPLTSIASYTELLSSGAADWPESDRMMLEVVSRNTAQLRALVEELLDLAAVESGHLTLDPQEIDFAELVDLVVEAGECDVHRDLGESLLLWGDPERLRQVVEHLISNAIKFGPEKGRITVELETEGEFGVLRISDEGIGIPAEEQDRVFDVLYRSTTTQHSGIPGAGLGLTLTKALVEAHGGTLTLTPGADRGTVATVRLPLEYSPAQYA
jgi:PAS domain S-box-containing protein